METLREGEGFVVHAFSRMVHGATQLCYIGRLSDGGTFAALVNGARPRLYVRASDEARVRSIDAPAGRVSPSPMRTMDGEPCALVEVEGAVELDRLAQRCAQLEIRTYEADLKLHDLYLLDRGIHGSLRIEGAAGPGKRVDWVFVDPTLTAAEWEPSLTLLSLDIETNPYGEEIRAIGYSFVDRFGAIGAEEVLLAGASSDERFIRSYPTERELLAAFRTRLLELDPDIITGWNVVDFDVARIIARLEHYRLPLDLGRSSERARFLRGETRKPSVAAIPGRQVIDGLRLMRSGPRRFPDQSLEAVAQEILGYGKEIEATRGREKLAEIERMYKSDPSALCRYCLADARLVREILAKTGMIELTLKRCRLIGISLGRAWTSIASFESIYIEALHRASIVAPTLGVDPLPLTEAPGGAIINPESGLFDNVFVFDFQSLYPSIMRTFNIDPLGFVPDFVNVPAEGLITAPNGARFRRGPAILPELLERFFASRAAAKQRGDEIASYVYKIILNSFYGVLGASGCRFAGSELAGAITSFGQSILFWCRDFMTERGYRVLYGDTDSLFVLSGAPPDATDRELHERGAALCEEVNRRLSEHLVEQYGVRSYLLLQFQKIYVRFFIPPLRGGSPGAGRGEEAVARGRAKGYAGAVRRTEPEGAAGPAGAAGAGEAAGGAAADASDDALQVGASELLIDVKGMEAVRRDWTEAAKRLQLSLLRLAFGHCAAGEIRDFVRRYVRSVVKGEMDDLLVYTKALRKSIDQYTAAQPAHVKAAQFLDEGEQGGLIRYVWTREGPQPVESRSSPIDYGHYVDKQLRPIARSFSEALGIDFDELFEPGNQLSLF